MLFNSLDFIVFFVAIFALYYVASKRTYQVGILIIASFIFYSWHEPYLTTLLVVSICINAFTSFNVAVQNSKKIWAWAGVTANLLILAYFKYAGLFAKTFLSQSLLASEFGQAFVSLPLPIGISFFTFQGISLVVDVYKGGNGKKIGDVKDVYSHFFKTTLFIAFFPSLIAGPIVKAHDFYYQIAAKKFSEIDWDTAIKALILGYFLKCVLADNLKEQTFWIAYPYFKAISSIDLLVLLVAYSAQIFSDFAGYSYIAIGLAHLFGYKLMKNFDWPYISTSFSEFWKRWHISLSTFLKEYLYIPLGGNRKGELRTYLNLILVMFLGGLWHGAAWSYAIWGAAHGLALAIERGLTNSQKNVSGINKFYKMIFVFCYVTLAWLLFKLPEFNHVLEYIKSIFENFQLGVDKKRIFMSIIYSSPVFAFHALYYYRHRVERFFTRPVQIIVYSLLLFIILTSMGSSGEFIYFQF